MCYGCCCCGKEKSYNKIKLPFDLCVIYEGCDAALVAPLLHMLDFTRADGSNIRVFPKDHASTGAEDDYVATMEALDTSCAILIVLSDASARSFTSENGNESSFFKLIEKACEKEKQNTARLLPLFMSHHIEHEGQVGLVKFSTWAYKCKNEHVRSYIEHIGSLQGLFVDPSDWVAKWEKLYSFWEETHDELVPLTLFNFCQEVDFSRIRRMVGGGILGLCCGLCFTCVPAKTKFWHECKLGLVIGNMACYIVAAVIMFAVGLVTNCSAEPTEADRDLCEMTGNVLFIVGGILALVGFALGFVVYILSQKRIKEKLPPQLGNYAAAVGVHNV